MYSTVEMSREVNLVQRIGHPPGLGVEVWNVDACLEDTQILSELLG